MDKRTELEWFRVDAWPVLVALFVGLFLLMPQDSHSAERVENLYQVTVPIDDLTRAGETRAIREGFKAVLSRLTGLPVGTLESRPELSDLISQANQFVFEFSSTSVQALQPDGFSISEDSGLWIQYDQPKVDQVITDWGLPRWSSVRPRVLYWLVTEAAPGTYFYAPEAAEPAGNLALLQQADLRGIPVRLAGYSATEQVLFPAADAWNLDMPALRQISLRYEADVVAVIRYRWNSEGMVEGEAAYVDLDDPDALSENGRKPGETDAVDGSDSIDSEAQLDKGLPVVQFSQFETALAEFPDGNQSLDSMVSPLTAGTVADLMRQIVDDFADRYAAERVFTVSDSRPVKLYIAGVDSYPQFKSFVGGFNQLEMLEGVRLEKIEGGTVVLAATLLSESDIFLSAVNEYMPLEQESSLRLPTQSVSEYRFSARDQVAPIDARTFQFEDVEP